jgi:hypothetical protein
LIGRIHSIKESLDLWVPEPFDIGDFNLKDSWDPFTWEVNKSIQRILRKLGFKLSTLIHKLAIQRHEGVIPTFEEQYEQQETHWSIEVIWRMNSEWRVHFRLEWKTASKWQLSVFSYRSIGRKHTCLNKLMNMRKGKLTFY